MASVEDVQPVDTMWLSPRNPKRMETSLASVPMVPVGMVYTLHCLPTRMEKNGSAGVSQKGPLWDGRRPGPAMSRREVVSAQKTQADIRIMPQAMREKYPEARPRVISGNWPVEPLGMERIGQKGSNRGGREYNHLWPGARTEIVINRLSIPIDSLDRPETGR